MTDNVWLQCTYCSPSSPFVSISVRLELLLLGTLFLPFFTGVSLTFDAHSHLPLLTFICSCDLVGEDGAVKMVFLGRNRGRVFSCVVHSL